MGFFGKRPRATVIVRLEEGILLAMDKSGLVLLSGSGVDQVASSVFLVRVAHKAPAVPADLNGLCYFVLHGGAGGTAQAIGQPRPLTRLGIA